MADSGIFATHAEILRKAGANVSSTLSAGDATADAHLNDFITQAESFINVITRVNYSDTYTASLNVDVKGVLKEAASNLAAMYCITYDMSNYTSRAEAETMLDVLRDNAFRCISLLRDKKHTDFITNA